MNSAKRILLIEDEEAMIAGLEYALAKEGFSRSVPGSTCSSTSARARGARPRR
jgi:hypothetical protein